MEQAIDYELLLYDRIEAIKTIINKYGEENFYLSFSGGEDSTVLHYLLDQALPGNQIPRVFINTGIEYRFIVEFVESMQVKDERVQIINSGVIVKKMLEEKGYPFKSKEHSKKIGMYQKGSQCEWVKNYLDFENGSRYACPKILRYQLSQGFKIKLSDKCCYELKKKVAHKWAKQNKKPFTITGMRKDEGGQRANHTGCVVFDKSGKLKSFKPLNPVSDSFEKWFIKKFNVQLCKLYYPPYNFKRTGCKGCPYALDLQEQLKLMDLYLPDERKQCEMLWKPIYDEYRRIGYRLDKEEQLILI